MNEAEWNRVQDAMRSGDHAGALYLLKKIEKEGCHEAQVEIGHIYEMGKNGVNKNYEEARRWYIKASNLGGDPLADWSLGRLYYFGIGVERDYEKAFSYFSKSARCEEAPAIYMLARMYEKGQGIIKDIDKAIYYYEKAYEKGILIAKREVSFLYIKKGRIILGIMNWIKTIFELSKIYFSNPKDRRLRVI